MELMDFIQVSLNRAQQATKRAVDSLTPHELMWRPGPEANSIGLILFHQARSEDIFIQGRIQGTTQVWESERWYEKLGFPTTETGGGYTTEQVAAFRVPEVKDLLAYSDAIRAQTLAYLKEMTPDKLDSKVTMGRMGEISIGTIFAIIVVHTAQHAGDIGYIRGLQRGMNK